MAVINGNLQILTQENQNLQIQVELTNENLQILAQENQYLQICVVITNGICKF